MSGRPPPAQSRACPRAARRRRRRCDTRGPPAAGTRCDGRDAPGPGQGRYPPGGTPWRWWRKARRAVPLGVEGKFVDLYEYQAKELFAAHGVPVLPGEVADTPEEARAAAAGIGTAVVVKAQVKTGGRGKAGGVKLAKDADEAAEKAAAILGLDIKGHVVKRVLVTEASDIDSEYYVSYLLDRANRTFLAMASVEGGMEIEQLAVERPEALARVPVDPMDGVDAAKAAEIADAAGFGPDVRDQVIDVLVKLWDTFVSEDATLVEVNPLVKTPDGRVVALDGKVTLDGNADFRHAGTV